MTRKSQGDDESPDDTRSGAGAKGDEGRAAKPFDEVWGELVPESSAPRPMTSDTLQMRGGVVRSPAERSGEHPPDADADEPRASKSGTVRWSPARVIPGVVPPRKSLADDDSKTDSSDAPKAAGPPKEEPAEAVGEQPDEEPDDKPGEEPGDDTDPNAREPRGTGESARLEPMPPDDDDPDEPVAKGGGLGWLIAVGGIVAVAVVLSRGGDDAPDPPPKPSVGVSAAASSADPPQKKPPKPKAAPAPPPAKASPSKPVAPPPTPDSAAPDAPPAAPVVPAEDPAEDPAEEPPAPPPTPRSGDPRAVPPGTPAENAAAFKKLPVSPADGPPMGGIGRSGIHVDQIAMGSKFDRSRCHGDTEAFSIGKVDRANVCIRVVHPRQKQELAVIWQQKGGTVRRSKMSVKEIHAYRTRGYLVLRKEYVGDWTVKIMSSDGVELARHDFRVVP